MILQLDRKPLIDPFFLLGNAGQVPLLLCELFLQRGPLFSQGGQRRGPLLVRLLKPRDVPSRVAPRPLVLVGDLFHLIERGERYGKLLVGSLCFFEKLSFAGRLVPFYLLLQFEPFLPAIRQQLLKVVEALTLDERFKIGGLFDEPCRPRQPALDRLGLRVPQVVPLWGELAQVFDRLLNVGDLLGLEPREPVGDGGVKIGFLLLLVPAYRKVACPDDEDITALGLGQPAYVGKYAFLGELELLGTDGDDDVAGRFLVNAVDSDKALRFFTQKELDEGVDGERFALLVLSQKRVKSESLKGPGYPMGPYWVT